MKSYKIMLVAILILTVSCGSEKAELSKENPLVLKAAMVDNDRSNYYFGMVKFAEEVERLTEGKIKVEVFHSAQLGSERDAFEGLQLGTIDIATVASAVLGSFVPEMTVLDAPFMLKSYDHANRVIDGEVGEYMNEKLALQDFNTLGWMYSGFRNVFSSTMVSNLSALKGVKIRTMENPMHVQTFEALGAIATPMPAGEVFTAIQQGTIDAAENATANVYAGKFYEIVKSVTKTGHFFTYIGLGISTKALNKIPEDLKPALYEAGKIAAAHQRELLLLANEEAEAELKKLGIVFYEMDSALLADKVQHIYVTYKDSMPQELIDEVRRLETELK